MSTDSQSDNSSKLGVITRTEPIHARYNIAKSFNYKKTRLYDKTCLKKLFDWKYLIFRL